MGFVRRILLRGVGGLKVGRFRGFGSLGLVSKGCLGVRYVLPGKSGAGVLSGSARCCTGRVSVRKDSGYCNMTTGRGFVTMCGCNYGNRGTRLML